MPHGRAANCPSGIFSHSDDTWPARKPLASKESPKLCSDDADALSESARSCRASCSSGIEPWAPRRPASRDWSSAFSITTDFRRLRARRLTERCLRSSMAATSSRRTRNARVHATEGERPWYPDHRPLQEGAARRPAPSQHHRRRAGLTPLLPRRATPISLAAEHRWQVGATQPARCAHVAGYPVLGPVRTEARA